MGEDNKPDPIQGMDPDPVFHRKLIQAYSIMQSCKKNSGISGESGEIAPSIEVTFADALPVQGKKGMGVMGVLVRDKTKEAKKRIAAGAVLVRFTINDEPFMWCLI